MWQWLEYIRACMFEFCSFFKKRLGRQDHAVTDIAGNVRMQDARGNQAQNGFLAIDPQRMAGIVTTLKTDHSVRRFSQPVDDLSLAFITPLGADYNNILAHVTYQKRFGPKDAKAKVGLTYTI